MNPMDSIEPAKAPRIRRAEPMTIPRLRHRTITRDTVSLAPEEMPSTKGPAMGLAKKVWSRKPDTLSAPPRMAAASTRGSRIPQMMPVSGPASRRPRISRGVKSTLPALMFHSSSASTSTARNAKQRIYRSLAFFMGASPSRSDGGGNAGPHLTVFRQTKWR